ncbi:MAG: RIP metalloprotease RseP [Balneolaceae bacterium]|nr:RIP metalloprotease RseP [Balneolaceae bacterium]
MELLSLGQTILIFVAALFILVFVHELGHFLAAKAFGMRVEKFSIGFPPKILGFTRGETEYSIGATPLGGFVKVSGMLDESMDSEALDSEPQPWEYRSRPVWQRMVVITAGVIFNMILAALIYIGVAFSTGETMIPAASVEGIYVEEGSLAYDLGFRTDDRLVAVNGQEVEDFQAFLSPSALSASQVSYDVIRNGERITLAMPSDFLDELSERPEFITADMALPSMIGAVSPGSPADNAGLRPGDRIVELNGNPVTYWAQLVEEISQTEGSFELVVEREGDQVTLQGAKESTSDPLGINLMDMSQMFDIERRQYSVGEAVVAGVGLTGETTTTILQGLRQLFTGQVSVRNNLGGPIAIASVAKQATDSAGWIGFWNITAFLSITLAIMNMLPIPVLDGGHFIFLLYEAITRREPSLTVKMWAQQIGFYILIAVMIFAFSNDILRLLG